MKRLVGFLTFAVVAAVAAFLFSDSATAQEQIFVESTASETATEIVNGRILSTTSVELDNEVFRVSEIEVMSALKGALSGTILVETPGGERSDGTVVFVSHTPKLEAGELVQLALTPRTDVSGSRLAVALGDSGDVYSVVHGSEGAYGLLPDGVGRAQAVGDYVLTGASWPEFAPPVGFYVNPANSGLGASATIAAVSQGFAVWENDGGSDIDFVYKGTTNRVGLNLNDGQNTVSWVSSGAGWLAQASWIATGNGDIIGFDVRVNRSYRWSSGAVGGRYDIATVVAHEVGHGIGFGHAPASSELMYFQIRSGLTKPLGPGDQSGAAFLYPTAGPPQITSPSDGAKLPCGSPQLRWSGPRNGVYTVHVGSTQNGADYMQKSAGSNLSTAMTGLPNDGSPVYVRLWFKPTGGSWSVKDTAVFEACGTPPQAQITSPSDGAKLACGSPQLRWTGPRNGVYTVHVGSSPNGSDYMLKGAGSSLSTAMTGLPNDGSPVYVRLWFKPTGGSWSVRDTAVFEACGTPPPVQITTPSNGANLSCSSATLRWQGGLNGVYTVHVGSSPNGSDYMLQGAGSNLSLAMTGLPNDGSPVYVRLWFKPTGGSWSVRDTATYTAC